MRLIIMGPPGAGKGTQALALSSRLGVPTISTGDIFRANVAAGTTLGREAERYMQAGEYVPDEVTNQMVADRLQQGDVADGFLLDGYPRTHPQVDVLDAVLGESGHVLDAVLVLAADHDVVIARLVQRDDGRADDTADVVRRRLEVYEQETAPLVALYRGRGLVAEVDGSGTVPGVAERILHGLDEVAVSHRPTPQTP